MKLAGKEIKFSPFFIKTGKLKKRKIVLEIILIIFSNSEYVGKINSLPAVITLKKFFLKKIRLLREFVSEKLLA